MPHQSNKFSAKTTALGSVKADAPETDAANELADGSSGGEQLEQPAKTGLRRFAGVSRISNSGTDNGHARSLRSKLVLALAIMLAVAVAIDEFVRQRVIAPEFANLERIAAIKDTNRVLLAFDTDVENLAELSDIGARHYRHLKQEHDSSAQVNLATIAATIGLKQRDHAAVVNRAQGWQWLAKNPETGDRWDHGILEDHLCLSLTQAPLHRRGMTTGGDGQLYLFATSSCCEPTSKTASCDDVLVIARPFDDEMLAELERRTSVSFTIEPNQESQASSGGIVIEDEDHDELVVTSALMSPSGNPMANVIIRIPRDVTMRSEHTTAIARHLSLCGACLSLLLLLLLLQRIVIGRIETIREHTERIAQSGIIAKDADPPKLTVAGADEIGQLADSFERMQTRLGDAQRRLADASHAAGMSVVADTVIHNVGNVLTNVNSLIESASQRVDQLRIEPLDKLANRLRDQEIDTDLQQAMPAYLTRLSQTLEDDRDDVSELLRTLTENVQHIHQVIRDQSRHAKQTIEWSDVSINQIIGEAVRCCQARLDQDHVCVHFNLDSDTLVHTDRSLFLQVLINIIGNARNAMRDTKGRQPQLRIDLIRTVSTTHVRFRDNGCGMSKATLSRIFDAHFTTRQSGSGLGLHFCAIAMKRLGGTIHAESDGLGEGATFVVEVPMKRDATEHSSESEFNRVGLS